MSSRTPKKASKPSKPAKTVSRKASVTTKAKKKAATAKPKSKTVKSSSAKATASAASAATSGVSVGKPAPAFTLPSGSGDKISLKDLRGKLVVLYFYPKDMTSGCTTEACDFRDRLESIDEEGAVVLGVSPDSAESHVKFADKHGLQFPLLADVGSAIAKKYGVWQEKSLYGRKFMGIVRSTFLIDREGKIARVWRNVKVAGHADEVLAAVQELAAQPV